ncbi:MAG: hypothetical protein ACOZIN_14075 [Myxococcota bacterium]
MRIASALAVFAAASSALADESPPSLELSLKAGGHFPQVVSRLGTSFDGVLKVGYAPLPNKQVQFFADLGYSQPAHLTESNDPRLQDSGADFSSRLLVQDLRVALGANYFFASPSENLLPYAGASLRTHFLRAVVVGEGGAQFGQSQETVTRFGGALFGGAGYRLGPGLLLGEVNLAFVPVLEKVTGRANVGALAVLLGYGLLL